MEVSYFVNRSISPELYIELLNQTTLGARRPVDKLMTIKGMLDHADLLVSAWVGEQLVGVARSVTDYHFCCFLSDLAVSGKFQSQGIGKKLIHKTFESLNPGCDLVLHAAPQARKYYPKIGFTQHQSCWQMHDVSELV